MGSGHLSVLPLDCSSTTLERMEVEDDPVKTTSLQNNLLALASEARAQFGVRRHSALGLLSAGICRVRGGAYVGGPALRMFHPAQGRYLLASSVTKTDDEGNGEDMPDDDIEIGEDIDVEVVLDEDDNVIGTVTDDLVVASAPEGSLVDETIDVRDADGNLIVEDEIVTVYDADSHVVAKSETITLPLDSE